MNEFTFKITYSLQTRLSSFLRGPGMITQKDINSIDRSYFEVLGSNPYCITLRSKNTSHEWHLLYYEYLHRSLFRIYHRHSRNYPFHAHGHAANLPLALGLIKKHDSYFIRKTVAHKETVKQRRMKRRLEDLSTTKKSQPRRTDPKDFIAL